MCETIAISEKMAAKTLIRSGASLMNRFLSKPTTNLVQNNLRSSFQQGQEIPPYFFPSLSNLQSSLNSRPNDTVSIQELNDRGFLYPSGLPSLEFFLPEAQSFIIELEHLTDEAALAIETPTKFSTQLDKDSSDELQQVTCDEEDETVQFPQGTEVTEYATLIAVVSGMVKQNYAMQ